MGISERIKEIEEEMAKTQKNKATEYHMGQLKARLVRNYSLKPQFLTSNYRQSFAQWLLKERKSPVLNKMVSK
jgi:ribosome-interacting GTPase 1